MKWHFLTGSIEKLQPIWEAYNIWAAPDPEKPGEVIHTQGVYVIDQAGQFRWYISPPLDDEERFAPPLSELLTKRIQELLSLKR